MKWKWEPNTYKTNNKWEPWVLALEVISLEIQLANNDC